MANRALVISLSLIMQLSIYTVQDVDANINSDTADYSMNQEYSESYDQQTDILEFETEILITTDESLKNPEIEKIKTDIKQESKREIDPNKPMIALTYDDGPSKYTKEILDLLKENNSAATFFVLGSQASKYEDTVKQMIENGNQIGNHSYDHKRLTLLNDEELYDQINKTDNLIYEIAMYRPFVMRPPYGSTTEALKEKIQKPIINWSIDTRDWESRNAETITKIICENVKDGDIILMHDLYESSLEASKKVIPELINRGYQLVTISELSESREIILRAGQTYYKIYK
ncbi:polysaccharide deacetylase family protein [Sedimentibacter saalensis]|uniref:Peptidoglycan/xylan/chitin deacetylase (PgdA/CDA1 family) n=1 Tax=Sedimentibacter saalensis TaxID=130788 RepID=A0A562JBE8_9FIRM|nr:polysaccharide deacetylase family protein [Sedimentibacter saalensis]TWH80420.1 peptidoglycan/xylan/chitin deacetylase (PgdA/CDA1 family) [Sedimentibacter saalensis]